MRIIGGRFKGLGLTPVGKGDAGAHLRPTTDRVRESLFSMLDGGRFGAPIADAHVLDLFAGTGALGLEALSRGAASITFVENGRPALKLLTANIAKTRAGEACRVLRQDATRLSNCDGSAASLVFLDPPYGAGKGALALRRALESGWIAGGALIVWEDDAESDAPGGFSKVEARKFGQTWLTFLRTEDAQNSL
ncbi:MAG: 16S rRNA (guanine(966)-N(2))-methyltransferase RsmD [Pseudomonadota bacterium]